MTIRIRGFLVMLGIALLSALAGWSVPRVAADYARPTRSFNVCMLLLHGDTTAPGSPVAYWNSDPWFLPVMHHSPFKPAGWTLSNPLAPAVLPNDGELVASGEKYRLDGKGGSGDAGSSSWFYNGKGIGDRLSKDDPTYWAVKLDDISLDALATFDLLIINGHSQMVLLNNERDALAYLLNRGATIWINNSQRNGNQIINFFLDPPIFFQRGPYNTSDNSSKLVIADPSHWLLNGPYALEGADVRFLRDNRSGKSYLMSGIAGYTGGANSQVQNVVSLFHQNPNGTYSYDPAIAAGRMGNGLLIVTAVDQMGASSDWWELHHNYYDRQPPANTPYKVDDLNMWPYSEGLGASVPADARKLPTPNVQPPLRPNRHYTYMASSKFFFNMLARPQHWPMPGGNPLATRALPVRFATSLSQSWTTPFNTLCDPVTMGQYVAVTGSSLANVTLPTELRVYRIRGEADANGTVLDYPYGLFTDTGTKVGAATLTDWAAGPVFGRGAIRCYAKVPYVCISAASDGATPPPAAPAQWRAFPRDAVSTDAYNPGNTAPIPNEIEQCFAIAVQPTTLPPDTTSYRWCGSPIIGRITEQGSALSRTVVFGLLAYQNAGKWMFEPHAYALDPVLNNVAVRRQVGDEMWTAPSAPFEGGVPHASMTLANNKLVITTFGKTSLDAPYRITIVDARTGQVCVRVGGNPEWGANLKPTGAASLISAQVEFDASDLEMGVVPTSAPNANYNLGQKQLRREMVELLALTGEYFTADDLNKVIGKSALFLAPPTLVVRSSASNQGVYFTSTAPPSDLRLTDANTTTINIGSPSSNFRQKHILSLKAEGNTLKITFRSWDIFMNAVIDGRPPLKAPFKITFTPDRVGVTPATAVTVQGVQLSMGYPLQLRGSRAFPTNARSTMYLHDGEAGAGNAYGYGVDVPPLIYRDQAVVGTNTQLVTDLPLLRNTAAATMKPVTLRESGTLTGTRLKIPALSSAWMPGMAINWISEVAWQFHGNTQGPRPIPLAQGDFWYSNFPFPPAVSGDTIFTTAVYDGHGAYGGIDGNYAQIPPTDLWCGMLYAINPAAPRYLQQVVSVGLIKDVGPTANMLQILLPQAAPSPALRVGGRALLKGFDRRPDNSLVPFTWDMGTITGIRQVQNGAGGLRYMLSFDRQYKGAWNDATRRPFNPAVDPAIAPYNPNIALFDPANPPSCWLMVATSTPYVSHVRAWNTVTGSEPQRAYLLNGQQALRLSAGLCTTPPANDSANPDPAIGATDVMIAVNGLEYTCHEPAIVDTAVAAKNKVNSLLLSDFNYLPADWKTRDITYLPQRPMQLEDNQVTPNTVNELSYTVDARTGRLLLTPRTAGEFADRFVVVHYFTDDLVKDVTVHEQKVHHAEIMYIPSPVRWEYLFPDAVPDSGPTVVGDTLYVTAQRRNTITNRWEPVLYAFPTVAKDPLHVQPLWVQSLPVGVPIGDPTTTTVPYRGVTTAIPTPNGLLVGTAMPNGVLPGGGFYNALALFTDRGLLIGDGHRVLRANHDGQLTREVAGTKDYDPAPLLKAPTADPVTALLLQTTAITQQAFTLITRVRHLPNGNTLVCDTGGNRVTELTRDGTVAWQYPDGGLTYVDPDRTLDHDLTRTEAVLRALRLAEIAAPGLRLSGPRDVRRYYKDVPVANLYWTTGSSLAFANQSLKLNPDVTKPAATVRWEITLIADTGNNRILEVRRPLVRLEDVDLLNQAFNLNLEPGFCYRPDLMTTAGDLNTRLIQTSEVLVDGAALKTPEGLPFAKTLSFTAAMRYPGADGTLQCTQDDPTLPSLPAALVQDIRTRELLVAVGNPVADPGNPTGFLRTAFLHVPVTPGTSAECGVFTTLRAAAAVGSGTAGTPLAVNYVGDLKVGDEVRLGYIDPVDTTKLITFTSTITALSSVTNTVTLAQPLDKAFAIGDALVATKRWNALQIRPAPRLALGAAAGDTLLKLDYLCHLGLGDTIQVVNPATAEASLARTITNIDVTTNIITLNAGLNTAFPAGSTVGSGSPSDYAQIRQLDLVSLHNANYTVTQTNALVVDAAGVREVPCAPAAQQLPVFEMWQRNYRAAMSQTATWYADGGVVDKRFPPTADNTPTLTQDAQTGDGAAPGLPLRLNFTTDLKVGGAIRLISSDGTRNFTGKIQGIDYAANTIVLDRVIDTAGNPVGTAPFPAGSWLVDITLKTKLLAWVQDDLFAPVAVLRLDAGNGGLGNPAEVRYLIAQMNATTNANPASWPGGTPVRRVHLFEARWYNKAVAFVPGAENTASWRIIDAEGNYYVYPDPVLPDYPNLPGWSYPLTQPLALDRD